MRVEMVVEMPARSGNKYEVDSSTGTLHLDRHLVTAARCPLDYGHVAGTRGEDGDPIDALLALDEPAVPGCHVAARPVAVLWIRKRGGREPKILCVPDFDAAATWRDLGEVPQRLLREIGQFFETYKDIEEDEVTVESWEGREAAEREVEARREE
jgi:inorganic pyrophosphatase